VSRASVLAILISLLLGGTLAAAQECRGFAPFQKKPVHLFARSLLGTHSDRWVAGVGLGVPAAFGALEFGLIDVDSSLISSVTVGGAGGLQFPVNEHRTAFLCPIVDLSFAKGPKDFIQLGRDYRETDVSYGVAGGVVLASPGRHVEFIPTVSITSASVTSKLIDSSGSVTYSNSQSFGVLSLGVGLVFAREVSVTPSFSSSFGRGPSTTFSLRFAFAFGRSRSPVSDTGATSCAGLASTDSAVYDTTQVTERPKLRSVSEPWYPPMQRDLAIEGRVIVDLVVGSDGAPDQSSVRIVQNVEPAIDHAAVRWIGSVSYWPACRDGRPVRAHITQPVDFCAYGCHRQKS
jgi:TonB family protein